MGIVRSSSNRRPGRSTSATHLLRLFGGASLEGGSGPLSGRVAQRRQLALLALLASARGGGLSRDKLVAYLWPDADTERARPLLSDSLYLLNKALAPDAVLASGDELRLNPHVVGADVRAFEETREGGDLGAAVELYTGPFLDGFYLSGNGEFERWAEAERERYARAYRSSLEQLAGVAAEQGDLRLAVEWCRRRAAADPYDGVAALRLMEALATSGDVAGALRHGQAHAQLLRHEFDAAPAAELAAFLERLRRGESAEIAQPEPGALLGPAAAAVDSAGVAGVRRAPRWTEFVVPVPPADAHQRQRAGWPLLRLATVLVAGLVLGGSVWLGMRGLRQPAAGDQSRIAVLPFEIRGDPDLAYLGEGMAQLMARSLDGAGQLNTVDVRALLGQLQRDRETPLSPVEGGRAARQFGAGLYVMGGVTAAGGELRIEANLYAAGSDSGRLTLAAVQGSRDRLFELVDELTAQLLAGRHSASSDRMSRLASTTTGSLEALKAYLQGEAEYRHGHFREAVAALRRAVAADSSFALAYYSLSIAGYPTGQADLQRWAIERAVRHAATLAPRDRLLVDAQDAFLRADGAEAERLYRAVVGMHPDDVEAWFRLGETQFHLGPLEGRSIVAARAAYERVLAFQPDKLDALTHLARIAVAEGDRELLDAAIDRAMSLQPDNDIRLHLRALRAFALRDASEQERVLADLGAARDGAVIEAAWVVDVYAENLADAPRVARLLTEPHRARDVQSLGHTVLAYLQLARGRLRAAAVELRLAHGLLPVPALEHRAFLATLPFLPADRAELSAARAALAAAGAAPDSSVIGTVPFSAHDGTHPLLRLFLAGLLSVRLQDAAAARAAMARLDSAAAGTDALAPARRLAYSLRAQLASGRPAVARALLEPPGPPLRHELSFDSPFLSGAIDRFARAEALSQVGRHEESLRWYASFAGLSSYDLIYLAPSHYRRGLAYDHLGNPAAAAAEYSKFIELWAECDPELRPLVDRARSRVKQLASAAGSRGPGAPGSGRPGARASAAR